MSSTNNHQPGIAKTAARPRLTGGVAIILFAAIGMLALFLWPYRAEDIEVQIIRNATGCQVRGLNYSGWNDRTLAPGIRASDVVFPLKMNIFIEGCAGTPGGIPYAATLVSAASGLDLAQGSACGNTSQNDLPCRLEAPPIVSLQTERDLIVRVVVKPGEPPREARLRLSAQRRWRSVVIDALMSV